MRLHGTNDKDVLDFQSGCIKAVLKKNHMKLMEFTNNLVGLSIHLIELMAVCRAVGSDENVFRTFVRASKDKNLEDCLEMLCDVKIAVLELENYVVIKKGGE